MLQQIHPEGDEIILSTPTPSDLRLILQDSVTNDDLREGCISLFEQVNSEVKLTQIEVFHAVHFLEYTTIHNEHREYPHKLLLETIFPEEEKRPTKLTSSLIKLVCHPSNKLRAAALSFFDVGISNSSMDFALAMAMTGLLPQLFEILKPHEIPINGTTIEFHRHITSIVDRFVDCSIPDLLGKAEVDSSSDSDQMLMSELIEPLFRSMCAYLRHLITPPACPTDFHIGLQLWSNIAIYRKYFMFRYYDFANPHVAHFHDEMISNMAEELASSLDLPSTRAELPRHLIFYAGRPSNPSWVKIFASILVRLDEGRQCSDLGVHALLFLVSHRASEVKLDFQPDGPFSIKIGGRIVSSLDLPSKSHWARLILNRPQHAAAVLATFPQFRYEIEDDALARDLKSGWFSKLFEAVDPSKLPFTNEFKSLHTQLIHITRHYLYKIWQFENSKEHDPSRSELDEICLSFHQLTKDYLVHLSLHPFTLISKNASYSIIDLLTDFFRLSLKDCLTQHYRDEMRKEMDAAALSLSSPPFLLTSELVCDLTDDEIMNVVDRIVALLESDTPLDDDTILRMCTFHTNQLKSVYLPELFRKAGRTTEQYFHAFKCLISLPFDYFTLCPIKCLLTPKPKTLQPTLDEWDEVDLATVGVVMPTIDENRLSFDSASLQLLHLAVEVLPQISHCASRLTLSQLERLISPSISVINKFFLRRCSSDFNDNTCKIIFVRISRLCNCPKIAQCLSRTGFFSRIVDGLLDEQTFNTCVRFFDIFLLHPPDSGNERGNRKKLRRRVPLLLEEGLQDVVDFLFVRKKDSIKESNRIIRIREVMQFLGTNWNIKSVRTNCLEEDLSEESESDDTD
ncbi:hypothetical protein BLNAU_14769 [Blattamonas nauphoetae]|uniref:Uncharacterized protein n=1 Tax=Blattamonas nauphoetae TaxID=2049346 RepID=A0ABQ9XI19_9EUKA|nr:hypothetical protein BLNAU_14769 [Blattamonas nauphoetae]